MRCKKCNSPLMPVSSGSVCPNGHGRIQPPMNRKVQRLNFSRYAASPKDRSFTKCRQLVADATVATGIPTVPVPDYRFDDGFLVHLDDSL